MGTASPVSPRGRKTRRARLGGFSAWCSACSTPTSTDSAAPHSSSRQPNKTPPTTHLLPRRKTRPQRKDQGSLQDAKDNLTWSHTTAHSMSQPRSCHALCLTIPASTTSQQPPLRASPCPCHHLGPLGKSSSHLSVPAATGWTQPAASQCASAHLPHTNVLAGRSWPQPALKTTSGTKALAGDGC